MKFIFEIAIFIALIFWFFISKLYLSLWFWVFVIVIFLVMQSEFIRHFLFQFISIVFGVIYLPLNMLLMNLTKFIEPFKQEDKVVYALFRILFFPLQVFVTIFSIPYEWILDNAH